MGIRLFLAMKICLLTFMIACSMGKVLGAVEGVDPPSGQVIADFENVVNITTIMCNVTNGGDPPLQLETRWSIQDFRDVAGLQTIVDDFDTNLFLVSGDPDPIGPSGSFRNRLTILRLTSELDGAIIFCGIGAAAQQANFPLRIYRPPILQDGLMFRIVENSLSIPIDLSQAPAAFPEPTLYNWTKDGVQLSSPPSMLTYSTITFDPVSRNDAGNYVVSATNFDRNNNTIQIGSDTGGFSLDVIYGPRFGEPGPLRRYALLEAPLSLVCGIDLDSNPQADITWRAPDGTTVMDNARYDLENGPEIVRLNFTQTILSDTGIWRCDIRVISDQDVVSNGSLVRQDRNVIGTPIVRDIQLTIIATPSQPLTLLVDSTGATWIQICWEPPLVANTSITFYSTTARNLNATGDDVVTVVRNTTTNSTFFNVTGLLPGTTYELIVVAVSQGGDIFAMSEPSESVIATTGFTVPLLACNDPVFSNGGITARWFLNHTGGQELSRLLLSYTIREGDSVSEPVAVTVGNVEATEVNIPRLVAGVMYTYNVTAENEIGPSYILCGPTFLRIGKPFTPTFGELTTGPRDTDVMIQIKTVASGVEDTSQGFKFNIVPVRNGVEELPQVFMRNDYQSGTLATVTVEGLTEGETYTFSATAENLFGMSEVANSRFITVGERVTPSASVVPPSQAADNTGAVIGGAVGGIIGVVLIVVIAIIVLAVLLIFCRGTGKVYRPNKAESGVKYQPAPTSDNNTKVQEVTVDIGEDMGGKHKEDTEIQYAELDTFRPPSQQKNNSAAKETKPVEPEEPVEYAIITTFKKKDNEAAPAVIEASAVPDPTPDTSEGDTDKTGTSTTLV